MKRKLPVIIAIILALAIALAACQTENQVPQTTAKQTASDAPAAASVAGANAQSIAPAPANPTPEPSAEDPVLISMDEAVAIALQDAGFAEKDVTGLHAELERDDGIILYDVDFYKDGKEYDYEIHAQTGKILKPVQKPAPTPAPSSNTTSASTASPAPKNITKDEAINKALSHAGLKKSQVSRLKAEQDKDDGRTIYEVDFETAEWEYEYEINAKTGKIIKAEKDRND